MSRHSVASVVIAITLSASALAAQQAPTEAPRRDVVFGVASCRYNGSDAAEPKTMFCGQAAFIGEAGPIQWLGFAMRPRAGVGISQGGGREEPSAGFKYTTRTTNVTVPVSVRASRANWKRAFVTVGGQADVQVGCKGSYESSGSSGTADCVDQGKFDVSLFAGGGAAVQAMGRPLLVDVRLRQGFLKAFKDTKIKHQAIEVQVSVPVGRRGRSGGV